MVGLRSCLPACAYGTSSDLLWGGVRRCVFHEPLVLEWVQEHLDATFGVFVAAVAEEIRAGAMLSFRCHVSDEGRLARWESGQKLTSLLL